MKMNVNKKLIKANLLVDRLLDEAWADTAISFVSTAHGVSKDALKAYGWGKSKLVKWKKEKQEKRRKKALLAKK